MANTMSNLFRAGLFTTCGFVVGATSHAQTSNVAIDVLPAMLNAAATEARAKGESLPESMKALISVVDVIKANPEAGKQPNQCPVLSGCASRWSLAL